MCVSCVHKHETEFCKKLSFKSMPKIRDDDGYTVVKCVEFKRETHN